MNRYFGLHTLEGEWHALLPRYLFLAERVKDMRILDIGCGAGLGASLLLELGAKRVDAIDHRPAVVELAKIKHAKTGLNLQVMLWEELEFEAETFDMILCLDPSSPVTDPNLLREVRRVLKPSGEYICAIERTTVKGVESLLPRYGYTHSAEQVALADATPPVPQLGELGRYFKRIFPIIQRPQYGFVFDYAPSEDASAAEAAAAPLLEQSARVGEAGQESMSVESASKDQAHTQRWIAVDKSFSGGEAELAGVELWFCGDEQLHIPRLREVRLPYYSIVERLKNAQPVTTRGADNPLLDEILDYGQESDLELQTHEFEVEERTGVFMPVRDEEPTGVRLRPSLAQLKAAGSADERLLHQGAQLESYITQLSSLHDRAQSDIARALFEARHIFDAQHQAMNRQMEALAQTLAAQSAQADQETIEAQRAQIEALEQALARVTQERDALLAQPEQAPSLSADALEDQVITAEHERSAPSPALDAEPEPAPAQEEAQVQEAPKDEANEAANEAANEEDAQAPSQDHEDQLDARERDEEA